MPMFFPSGPITRTSRARIFPLTLTNEPEEEKLREGKGRLKRPSSVETYSCRCVNGHTRNLHRLINQKLKIMQANNRTSATYHGFPLPCRMWPVPCANVAKRRPSSL